MKKITYSTVVRKIRQHIVQPDSVCCIELAFIWQLEIFFLIIEDANFYFKIKYSII